MSAFEESIETGTHQQLGLLAGTWKGTTKTWFEPGVLADESPMEGTIRPVLNGRFLLHEYRGSLQGKPLEGLAIYGYDLANARYESAWIDSFHMSTGIMYSQGEPIPKGLSVMGYYGNPQMPEPWGWRTEMELTSPDTLVITAFNTSPEGEESKATEVVYKRV